MQRPKISTPIGPITAGKMTAGKRNSGSLLPLFLRVKRVAIISISFPPMKNANTAPIQPAIERSPRSPMVHPYGVVVNVRLEVS